MQICQLYVIQIRMAYNLEIFFTSFYILPEQEAIRNGSKSFPLRGIGCLSFMVSLSPAFLMMYW